MSVLGGAAPPCGLSFFQHTPEFWEGGFLACLQKEEAGDAALSYFLALLQNNCACLKRASQRLSRHVRRGMSPAIKTVNTSVTTELPLLCMCAVRMREICSQPRPP